MKKSFFYSKVNYLCIHKRKKMKAKMINNRPVQFSSPELINVGDVIEQNNPPRGVNYWKVLDKKINGNICVYKVEMLSGSAFTGSVYYRIYEYKTIGKICATTAWFFQTMTANYIND